MNWKRFAWGFLRFTFYSNVLLCLLSLLPTQVYNFSKAEAFSGENWHNPYEEILDLDQPWQKGNFHAHGKNFAGLSNGKGSSEEVVSTYLDSLGYDWAAVSNYQKVANIESRKQVIRAYEHGIGLGKQHQLILGDQNSNWFDFPFLQFLNQKQTTVDYLQNDDNLVVIAHPKLRGAYSLEDMQSLRGYDCMEVLNHIGRSRDHWDAALSAGIPAYLISSDDSHNHHDLGKSGQNITVFKSRANTEKDIIAALKRGEAYGIDLKSGSRKVSERRIEIASLPSLTNMQIVDGEIHIAFDKPFKNIRFIGQGGQLKKEAAESSSATYQLQSTDTYIRVVAQFQEPGADVYLNPVFRYAAQVPLNMVPTVNPRQTRLYRLSIIYLLLGFILLVWRIEWNWNRKQKPEVGIRWAAT